MARLSFFTAFLTVIMLLSSPAQAQVVKPFDIDSDHTRVTFSVSHLGFSQMQGVFTKVKGRIYFSHKREDVEQSRVTAKIAVKSLDMGHEKLNKILMGPDYFNAKKHPYITFKSETIEREDVENGIVRGKLTMNGVTRPVTLHVRFNKQGWNSYAGAMTAGFSATGTLNRSDFEIKKSLPDVGDKITFRIDLEAQQENLEKMLEKQGGGLPEPVAEQTGAVPLALPAPSMGGFSSGGRALSSGKPAK